MWGLACSKSSELCCTNGEWINKADWNEWKKVSFWKKKEGVNKLKNTILFPLVRPDFD